MSPGAHFDPKLEDRLKPLASAVGGLRDRAWRRAFAAQIAPRPDDVIVELGCGESAIALPLALAEPQAVLIVIDSDSAALARAEARARDAGARIHFVRGLARDMAHALSTWAPTKIVSSLSLSAAPAHEQALILRAAHQTLRHDGSLHVAAIEPQRTRLLRTLLPAPGKTAPRADATLPRLMREAGFKAVDDARRIATIAGVITLFRARAH